MPERHLSAEPSTRQTHERMARGQSTAAVRIDLSELSYPVHGGDRMSLSVSSTPARTVSAALPSRIP